MGQKKRAQFIRTINKIEKQNENVVAQSQGFPKEKPGVIYVRQSTIAQVQKNLHSYEMQTSEFMKYFRENLGVTGDIEIIADDEGKSGTLDIHDRKGLMRVTHLVEGKELLNGERIGWVGAVHVNRLTRDQWLIVPGVLMKECYENDVWIATLRMQFNFNDEYCRRVFMLEAEEAARNLKWMKDIMHGGLVVASNNGFHDGRPVLPGYIVDHREYLEGDIKNPTYKKYIVYEPHAAVVRWLFTRYVELDGNFPALLREISAMPYIFPAFESWVSRRNIQRFSGHRSIIKDGPYKGCYKPSSYGIRTILTNPIYLGWWIPIDGGLRENNHEAIIDATAFTYAHNRLSSYNLEGNRQKPKSVVRNGHSEAILKKVAKGPEPRSWIYSRVEINHDKTRKDLYACYRFDGLQTHPEFTIAANKVDRPFTEKFLERLGEWQANGALDNWREKLENAQSTRDERKTQIKKSIREAEAKMQRINEVILDLENPPSKAQEISLKQMYEGLADKVMKLEQEMRRALPEDDSEEETIVLYQIWELIPKIQEKWDKLTLDEKMSIVGAFTRKVVFSMPSPGWIKVDVEWKIGQRDVAHLRRPTNGDHWTEEEDAFLRNNYSTARGEDILQRFPTRTWRAIRAHASRELKLVRPLPTGPLAERDAFHLQEYNALSLRDKEYAEEHSLDTSDKNMQWQRVRSGARSR